MEQFIIKHQDKIVGTISCFDRLVFKGYLPIRYAESMEGLLNRRGVLFKDFKHFASLCSDTVVTLKPQPKKRPAKRPPHCPPKETSNTVDSISFFPFSFRQKMAIKTEQ